MSLPSVGVPHLSELYLRIYFLRLSSEMFPFASHLKYGYSLDYAATELKVRISSKRHNILTPCRQRGTLLIGTATGSHSTLGNSPRSGAPRRTLLRPPSENCNVRYTTEYSSVAESKWTRADHCSMLQYMGTGKDSVMIIHMGVRA